MDFFGHIQKTTVSGERARKHTVGTVFSLHHNLTVRKTVVTSLALNVCVRVTLIRQNSLLAYSYDKTIDGALIRARSPAFSCLLWNNLIQYCLGLPSDRVSLPLFPPSPPPRRCRATPPPPPRVNYGGQTEVNRSAASSESRRCRHRHGSI